MWGDADQGLASTARQHDKAGARAPMRKHLGERLLLIWPDNQATRATHTYYGNTHITTRYRGLYTALARPKPLQA